MYGAILILLNVIAVGLLVWLARRLYESLAPLWLFPRGEFERARKLYEKQARNKYFASTRLVGRYGVAVCDMQLGRVEDALIVLRKLPYAEMRAPMRFGVDVAIGSALLQLDEDLGEAKIRFERAAALERAPDILLGIALAELTLGDIDRAEALYDEAAEMSAQSRLIVGIDGIMRRSEAMVRHSTVFLSGWYLARTGRMPEAAKLLVEVVEWPVRSWITAKAQSLLDEIRVLPEPVRPVSEGELDPPSTGGMVVDADPRQTG